MFCLCYLIYVQGFPIDDFFTRLQGCLHSIIPPPPPLLPLHDDIKPNFQRRKGKERGKEKERGEEIDKGKEIKRKSEIKRIRILRIQRVMDPDLRIQIFSLSRFK